MARVILAVFFFASNNFGQVIADFTVTDTVCVNAPVNTTNTSVGANSYGCLGISSITVNVKPEGLNNLVVPNAFTLQQRQKERLFRNKKMGGCRITGVFYLHPLGAKNFQRPS